MTHSGEACRIVEETIPGAGVHFLFASSTLTKTRDAESNVTCLHDSPSHISL